MSFRRTRPSATKASARLDLLARVIFAAFILIRWLARSVARWLILDLGLDPFLLVRTAVFALAEKADPRRQQPAGHESAQTNVNYFPRDYSDRPIGDRAADDCIPRRQE